MMSMLAGISRIKTPVGMGVGGVPRDVAQARDRTRTIKGKRSVRFIIAAYFGRVAPEMETLVVEIDGVGDEVAAIELPDHVNRVQGFGVAVGEDNHYHPPNCVTPIMNTTPG